MELPSPYRRALDRFAEAGARFNGRLDEATAKSRSSHALLAATWRIFTWQRSALEEVPRALASLMAAWPALDESRRLPGEDKARECARLQACDWLRREWAASLDPAADLIAGWQLPLDPPSPRTRVTAWSLGPSPDFALLVGFDSGILHYWDGAAQLGRGPRPPLDPPDRIPVRATALAGPAERRWALALFEGADYASLWDLSDPSTTMIPRQTLRWPGDPGTAQAGAIDPEGRRIAIALSSGELLIWGSPSDASFATAGPARLTLNLDRTRPIVALEFAPGGHTLLVSDDRDVVFARLNRDDRWALVNETPKPWIIRGEKGEPIPGEGEMDEPIRAVAVDWNSRRAVACGDTSARPRRLAETGDFLLEPGPPLAVPPGRVIAASRVEGSRSLALAVHGDPRRPLAWLDFEVEDARRSVIASTAGAAMPRGIGVVAHPAGPVGLVLDAGGWLSVWDLGAHREYTRLAAALALNVPPHPPIALIADRGAERPLWVVTVPDTPGSGPEGGRSLGFDHAWPSIFPTVAIGPSSLEALPFIPQAATFDPLEPRRVLVVGDSSLWLGTLGPDGESGRWHWKPVPWESTGPAIMRVAWSPSGDQAVVLATAGPPAILRPCDDPSRPDVVVSLPVSEMNSPGASYLTAAIGRDGRVIAAREHKVISWPTHGTESPTASPLSGIGTWTIRRRGRPVHIDPDRGQVWLSVVGDGNARLVCHPYLNPDPLADIVVAIGPVGEVRPGALAVADLRDGRRLIVVGDREGWLKVWRYREGSSTRVSPRPDLRAAIPLGMPIEQVAMNLGDEARPRIAVRDRAGRLLQFTLEPGR